MLLIYVLVVFMMILDSTPNADAQNRDYDTHGHLPFTTSNANPRLTAITTADGTTNIFRPYSENQQIDSSFVTVDFFQYSYSDNNHLSGRDVLPLFAVFDPNTTGLASDYVMGVKDDGTKNIVAVLDDNDATKVYCQDCIRSGLTGYTSTSWDNVRKRWVSLTDMSPGDAFAVSTDLMNWTVKNWDVSNPKIKSYVQFLEMFPITDQDDPSKTVWVLIWNTKPDEEGLVTLMWDTFQPDDNDRKYEQMGVLDASTYVNEYALVNDNGTDYRTRRILVSQRADYKANGILYDTYITFRDLTYKGGRLRQMPVSTVFGPPKYKRFFPTIVYGTGNDILSCLPPSRAFKIEAVLETVYEGSGFDLFLNPDDNEDCAVSFFVSGREDPRITLTRFSWFAPGPVPKDAYEAIATDFKEPISGSVKVLVCVDVCIIEYFVLDGLYVGSIFAFPNLSWNHHGIYSVENTIFTNLTFTKYDDEI